jgi:regulator of protease activity HflC (stomatin/prohibitin superfamily)
MAVKAFLSFLSAASVLVVVGGLAFVTANSARGRSTRPGIVIAVAGLITALVVIPLNAGLVLVEPNERGVVFRQVGSAGDALQDPITPGLSWVIPFVDQVIPYDVGQQPVTMEGGDATEEGGRNAVQAISSDGQVVFADVTVVFRINPLEVNSIHREWRNTYIDGFIVPVTRSEVRNAINNFGAEEIYSGGRAALEIQLREDLASAFEQQGFLLTDIRIRNIEFSDEFANAIEQKQIAEQEAQRAVFLVQQAEQEAEQARTQAQGEADATVIRAQGDADSIVIRGEAEAEALALINEILAENPNLIQYQYINELGDQVQLVIIPSNSPFLFDLEELAGEPLTPEESAVVTPEPTPQPTPTPSDEEGTENP